MPVRFLKTRWQKTGKGNDFQGTDIIKSDPYLCDDFKINLYACEKFDFSKIKF